LPRNSGDLTQERLKVLLHYDPETGIFTRLVQTGSRTRVGDVAGGVNVHGYRQVGVCGRLYYAHRLAWLYMTGEWPPHHTDHINGDRDDNRWPNLRLATHAQNLANSRKSKNNTSGLKGVSWDARKRKWFAQITVSRRHHFLGYFDDPTSAHGAYIDAAEKHFVQFARAA
jgi:hypothetical protein